MMNFMITCVVAVVVWEVIVKKAVAKVREKFGV